MEHLKALLRELSCLPDRELSNVLGHILADLRIRADLGGIPQGDITRLLIEAVESSEQAHTPTTVGMLRRMD